MQTPLRIAVSSVAGASGFGVLQCAKLLPYPVETYPLDISPHAMGLYMGTQPGTILPKPEQDIGAWVNFISENQIDALIPGADRDLLAFMDWDRDLKCLISQPEVIKIANDKYETALFLNGEADIDVPDFALPDDAEYWNEFPCVVKPRSDAASRGFHICEDRAEMYFYLNRTNNPMIQEYLKGDEVTANVFCDRDGNPVAHLAMLRKDRAGIGIETRPIESEPIREMLYTIAHALKPHGVLSVQLKMNGDVPLPFEINARMSGSSIVRATAGYNDLDMLLRHFVMGKTIRQPQIDFTKTYFRPYTVLAVETEKMAQKEWSWT